jgi:hypothetical protein
LNNYSGPLGLGAVGGLVGVRGQERVHRSAACRDDPRLSGAEPFYGIPMFHSVLLVVIFCDMTQLFVATKKVLAGG